MKYEKYDVAMEISPVLLFLVIHKESLGPQHFLLVWFIHLLTLLTSVNYLQFESELYLWQCIFWLCDLYDCSCFQNVSLVFKVKNFHDHILTLVFDTVWVFPHV